MRLKPGQTAPQMPPRGPKGPIKNPGGVRAAGNPRTPRDIGFGNRPTTMTGGPRAEIPTPVKPGGVGTTGFKSGSGGFASNLFGTGMKKGGKVKAISAPKASSASKKADGVAIKGKTKGRFV